MSNHIPWIGTFLAVLCIITSPCQVSAQDVQVLQNDLLRAEFSNHSLSALVDRKTGFRLRLADETFSLILSGTEWNQRNLSPGKWTMAGDNILFIYVSNQYSVKVIYELRAGWRFITKRIVVEPLGGATEFRVNRISAFQASVEPAPVDELSLPAPPSRTSGNWGTFLRFARNQVTPSDPAFGAFLLYQNPFNVLDVNGRDRAVSYLPELDWKTEYGAFASDPFCMGLYPLSGTVFPATAIPEWTYVADFRDYLGRNPKIDMAEADALVECVRSFLLYRPQKSIRVHVPWCENDYQIDVATPEGWAEFQRIIDRAAAVGCQYTLFTPANSELSSLRENSDAWGWENLLFFAMGQKIRKGEWNPAVDVIPPSLQRTLDYAKSKNIKLVSYSYPSLPFMQNPEWTKWAEGKVGGYNGPDMGLRSFQDWWLGKLVDFARATGAGGFSFDHWWIAYDNASSRYAQWHGCRRILETLRMRIPDVLIDGRQQYMNFGPWTWLAGTYPHPSLTDEQPESFVAFPDLHTDRISANRQRFAAWTYRMQRFCPPEIMPGFITHQTERSDEKRVMRRDRFRPRDWDLLGWKFSVLSSIGTAPFNHVVDYLPARDLDEFHAFSEADARWMRGWFDWTDKNASILKRIKPILGPPMIGRVDGTAACAEDRGFIFLFNPNYRKITAEFPLDAAIGLERGTQFILQELYPEEGRLLGHPQTGFWKRGDSVSLAVNANQAVVLEIKPASASGPVLFNLPGTGAIKGKSLILTNVRGEIGSTHDIRVRLPGDDSVDALIINGVPVPFRQAGTMIFSRIRFAGEYFSRSQPLWDYDAGFTGGVVKTSFRIPVRILDQLRARRESWPVPYTEDDLIAPWLGSHRLLIYAQIAEPDESQTISVTIDGKQFPVFKASNNIYGNHKRTFLGNYVDISSLEAEKEHVIEVRLPKLAAGRFQGLFFENIEPEYTSEIAR